MEVGGIVKMIRVAPLLLLWACDPLTPKTDARMQAREEFMRIMAIPKAQTVCYPARSAVNPDYCHALVMGRPAVFRCYESGCSWVVE